MSKKWNLNMGEDDAELDPTIVATKKESLRVSKKVLAEYEQSLLDAMNAFKTKGGLRATSVTMPKAIGVATTLVEVMAHMDEQAKLIARIGGKDAEVEMKVAKTHILARLVQRIMDNPDDFKD